MLNFVPAFSTAAACTQHKKGNYSKYLNLIAMITLYAILKSVHILMAIMALGANLSYPLWLYIGHKNDKNLPFALKGIQMLDDYMANPAYILSLFTGLGLCWYMHLNPSLTSFRRKVTRHFP